jgi:hypothetical protein
MQQIIIYGRLKEFLLLLKFPWACERTFSKYIENLGKVPSEMFTSSGLCCSDRDPLNTEIYTHLPKLISINSYL